MRYIILLNLFFAFTAKFNAQTITTIAGNGEEGFSGDGNAAVAAQLDLPFGLGSDASGNIYIGEMYGYRLRKVAANGLVTTLAGTGTQGYSNDGADAFNANITFPSGIIVKGSSVYFGDYGNARIRKIDSLGIITTFAGTGAAGNSGDGGPAASAQMRSPSGLAVDASGNIYFTDRNSNVVRKINTSGIISTLAGTGTQGYTGDQGPATAAKLTLPNGVAVDAGGNVYIADTGNNCVRKINANSGIITTIAGNGISGYSGDGGSATSAQLSQPSGVGVDAAGNIYISDTGNHCIRKINTSGAISTFAGTGGRGYSGDEGLAKNAGMAGPIGIVVTPTGEVYFADSFNHRVRVIR